jgi:hypothetical protein
MTTLVTGHTRVGLALHLFVAEEFDGGEIAGHALCVGHEIPIPNLRTPLDPEVNGCRRCFRKAAKLGHREFQDPYVWFDIDADGTCRERPTSREYFLNITSDQDLIDVDTGWCWRWDGTHYRWEDDLAHPRTREALTAAGFRLVEISSLDPDRLAEARARYFADDAPERD